MKSIRFLLLAVVAVLLCADPALAVEAAGPASDGLGTLGKMLGMGAAAAGGAIGQGKVASAALDGTARNPGAAGQMFMPFILGLVFIETLVLFTLVIAFLN